MSSPSRKVVAGRPPSVVDVGVVGARLGRPTMAWTRSLAVLPTDTVPEPGWHGSENTVRFCWNPTQSPSAAGPVQTAFGPPSLPAQPAGATNDNRTGNGSVVTYRAPARSNGPGLESA